MKKLFFVFISLLPYFAIAQDDLLNMLDEVEKKDPNKDKSINKVTGMFKDPKLISLQTPQTTGVGALNFNISHRFGNVGKASSGGVHTLYGWDAISDVRISFDYGITKSLQVGVARNKRDEAIDGSVKWRFMDQTLDNKVPLSICVYSVASFTPKSKDGIYAGADTAWIRNEIDKKLVTKDRFSYTSQIIFARKFASWLAIVIAPTYTHRNYVLASINPYNNKEDETDIFSVAAGIRLKITRSFSILGDYFYVSSQYRQKNPTTPYYAPLAVGFELETGGHVFHIDFTNAAAITPNYFIPNSADSWSKGGFKLGFNISRAFNIGGKKVDKSKHTESVEKHSESEQPTAKHSAVSETKTVSPQTTTSETTQKPIEKSAGKTTSQKDMYKVNAESVNMRAGASSSNALIMKINKGASVEVIEKVNADWWKIKYNEETGYVSSKFLSK